MKKPTRATPKPLTHFEQIPLEHVVAKIAKKVLIREPAARKTEPYSMRADGARA
jgi:hypothetical protein